MRVTVRYSVEDGVMTTFASYGSVAGDRQAEILRGLAPESLQGSRSGVDDVVALFKKFLDSGARVEVNIPQ
jgi:hypothetical protein